MGWLLIHAALEATKVAAEHGPLVDSGRIEGFAAVLLRTGEIVSEQTADSVLRVHERAILLGGGAYQFADLRRVDAAGSEFDVEQAEGLIRVTINYPKQKVSHVSEALVKAARAQGVRIGAPQD